MSWNINKKLFVLLVVFFIMVGNAFGKEQKPEVVILPFKCNTDLKDLAQGIENILRSELIRSTYLTVTEPERTYKIMRETVSKNLFVKIENVDVKSTFTKPDTVDVFSGLDQKTIIQIAEKVKADFAVRGALSQFGEKYRADIDVVDIHNKRTMGALVGECESKEKVPEMTEQLSQQVVDVCCGADATIQKQIDSIQSSYKQGILNYKETMDKLKNLSAEMPDSFAVHCALFSHYLGHSEMNDELIAEGEVIIKSFDVNNQDMVECLSSLNIDPFYELASVYIVAGKLSDAIGVYEQAVGVRSMNRAKYYKQLGVLYKVEDRDSDAIDAFKQVLVSDPTDFDIRVKLASMYEKVGDTSKALDQYRICLKYSKNKEEGLKVKEMINRLQAKESVNGK
jgi:TolB-like protein